jgi:hypothetical protein
VPGSREEVLNVEVARLLAKRGLVSAPEVIVYGEHGRRLPDVVVTFRGLRLVIEGKIADLPDAHGQAAADAQGRVDEGLAHVAVAVVYPAPLRTVAFRDLDSAFEAANLDVQVHTEAGASGWMSANGVGGLSEILVRTYEQLVNEDVVADAVAIIEAGIDTFVRELRSQPASATRLADLLEVGEPSEDEDAE